MAIHSIIIVQGAILARGYSLIYNADKTQVYTSASQLESNIHVAITMKEGERVTTIQEQHEQ